MKEQLALLSLVVCGPLLLPAGVPRWTQHTHLFSAEQHQAVVKKPHYTCCIQEAWFLPFLPLRFQRKI